jgi:hypothetical protein
LSRSWRTGFATAMRAPVHLDRRVSDAIFFALNLLRYHP